MATYRAIGATCEAVIRLLQQTWRPPLFDDTTLQFQVYRTRNFEAPMEVGVSLYLYRVTPNMTMRTPPPRPLPANAENQRRPLLPLDLCFLLTPWAGEASLEQEILGWMMRTLEDTPTLPSGLLNSAAAGVFSSEEQVQIVADHLSNEELFRIWDVLPTDYQISVPYRARVVAIDSELERQRAEPVLTRQLDFGTREES